MQVFETEQDGQTLLGYEHTYPSGVTLYVAEVASDAFDWPLFDEIAMLAFCRSELAGKTDG